MGSSMVKNFIIIFLGTTLFHQSMTMAQSCQNLFEKIDDLDITRPISIQESQTEKTSRERRKAENPFAFQPATLVHSQVLDAPYLPEKTRLIFSYENQQMRLYQEELVSVKVNGKDVAKVKATEIPLDLNMPFMINASSSVGRKFYRACKENGKGTLIFVDVNDLGWVNNNFALKTKAGDQFIAAVNRAIQQITQKQGLVFRLGGDEIGILIPVMKPKEINALLKIIENKTKEFAQEIFNNEQRRRFDVFINAKSDYEQVLRYPSYYKTDQIEFYAQKYFDALSGLTELAKYLQPSVSIGATYIGNGRSADAIQTEVEGNSHPHKITIKQSKNLPVGKYSTDPSIVNYTIAPLRYGLDYQFPLLPDMTTSVISPRPQYNFDLPVVEWTRTRRLYPHIGPYAISEFRPEVGPLVMKVEVYENGKPIDLIDLHTHDNTGFVDAQTVIAQKLITAFRESSKYREAWVNLLNLGKLNYFKNLSQTGDQALARVAEIIKGFLGPHDIAFKLKGSEFSVFIEAANLNEIISQLNVLFNSDPVLRQIYQDEIHYLQQRGDSSEKIADLQKLLDQPIVKIELR
jgi:GGDEF domain-containing protein